jgi:hypothetical protein
MIVNVLGHGSIEFPDTMTDDEVRDVLRQFEKKPDETIPDLCKSIESMIKNQKPQIIETQQLVEVEKQVVVTDHKIIEVEKIIEKERKPISWMFTISRDEDGINEVLAEPIDG